MIGSGDFRKVGRVFVTHRAYDHLERSVKPIPAWPLVNNSLYMSLLELQHGARQRLLHENQGFFVARLSWKYKTTTAEIVELQALLARGTCWIVVGRLVRSAKVT